ncbi:hypothetical protein BC937DRAFT_89444 [Endogone sp. FLAS-F59071]|nr:hypothetical protein BC937DRAFT_89444 [Endogone sp. FLAS-F59071]|eukprot:RUS22396.1 hypothetical protein BC937DRAFT_89444 [Endogone sp. FLAS-F59071]
MYAVSSRYVEGSNSVPSALEHAHPLLSFSFPTDLITSTEVADTIRKMNESYDLRTSGQYLWRNVKVEVESVVVLVLAVR